MTKKYRKKLPLPSKPFSHRETLYAQPTGQNVVVGIAFFAFFAFSVGVFLEKQYTVSLLPFSLAGLLAYVRFATVQKVDIFEDTLFVEYWTSTQTYKADEVVAVESQMVPVLNRYSDNIGSKKDTVPRICIHLKSGKTIRIPPSKRFNVQKKISKWRDKYQTSQENANNKER